MFGFTHSPVEWVYGINVYVLVCLSLRVCVCDRVYVWVLLMIHIILPTETDHCLEFKLTALKKAKQESVSENRHKFTSLTRTKWTLKQKPK